MLSTGLGTWGFVCRSSAPWTGIMAAQRSLGRSKLLVSRIWSTGNCCSSSFAGWDCPVLVLCSDASLLSFEFKAEGVLRKLVSCNRRLPLWFLLISHWHALWGRRFASRLAQTARNVSCRTFAHQLSSAWRSLPLKRQFPDEIRNGPKSGNVSFNCLLGGSCEEHCHRSRFCVQ